VPKFSSDFTADKIKPKEEDNKIAAEFILEDQLNDDKIIGLSSD